MVFGVFRRAVSVIGELISFGRAEEAQLDKLIERVGLAENAQGG